MTLGRSRQLFILTVVVTAAAVLPAPPTEAKSSGPDGAVVRDWTSLAFAAVRNARATDAASARLYAMVDTAMYDAVNGLESHPRWSVFAQPSRGNAGDPVVAAAAAAHAVLSELYPALQSAYDDQLAHDVGEGSPGQAKHGTAWGERVAAAVLVARANDGSQPPESRGTGAGPGQYRGTFAGLQYRNLAPFAINDADAYATAQPPALESSAYAVAFNDVKANGNGNVVDSAASATFQYWSLSGGTNQPPGAWLQVAAAVSADRNLSLRDTARLFALESMALVDTVAPTYTTKDRYFTWRPITAIREANTDDNDATTIDPVWTARGGSSASPEFWSGHSSFSAAGAAVLAGFFCADNVPFSLTTDSGAGQSRTYNSFSAAADEAGRSRVLGGLHFEFSNQAGLTAGRAVAAEVLERERACA
ncbi:MAG: hypothetical protein QOF21_1480 [Actinomycetota bacterium]|jgi:hypothetical protein